VLSLLVVPVVFLFMDDTEHFIKRMSARLRRKPLPAGSDPVLPPAPLDPEGRAV
jgi:hypothetical protein